MEADRIGAVNALLTQTEEAHGRYEVTELNGVYDQEWPRWYAEHAIEHGIGELLGHDVTVERLAQLLTGINADFEKIDPTPSESWATYAARRIGTEL